MKKSSVRNIIILISVLFLIASVFIYDYYKTFHYANTSFNQSEIHLYVPTGTHFNGLKKIIKPYLSDSLSFFKVLRKKFY